MTKSTYNSYLQHTNYHLKVHPQMCYYLVPTFLRMPFKIRDENFSTLSMITQTSCLVAALHSCFTYIFRCQNVIISLHLAIILCEWKKCLLKNNKVPKMYVTNIELVWLCQQYGGGRSFKISKIKVERCRSKQHGRELFTVQINRCILDW